MVTAKPTIDSIFGAAIEIGSAEHRQAYLREACGTDAQLIGEVDRLVRAHFEAGGFLASADTGVAATTDTLPSGEGPGTSIGPYQLLEQIGEGGMGLVFAAEQLQGVRRRVALKIIKPGMDTREVIARFEVERQALALMDHPNIARVLDAGVTGSGRPYFVMELVRGLAITEFCDQSKLTIRQRLELFVKVCQAVQHAHQKGIIHRDLKPSNVLVTVQDGVPVPKVIDFGVAKAIHQGLGERTVYTRFAQLIGTPLYMSPEQAEVTGVDVDTRSDVYSLGVLLYELLTGTTPFDRETLRTAGHDEIRRMIREYEPTRPSARVIALREAGTGAYLRWDVEPRKVIQTLSGELDWIVMKALEKDRNRRYESASALTADVQRYLHDEPVEACPPALSYRLRKFAHKNRQLLISAGTLAAVLVAATVWSTRQAILARQAQRQAEAAQDQAEAAEGRATTEAAIATAISEFLQHDVLRQVDSSTQVGQGFAPNRNLTVREALDRAATNIGERFRDRPLVEAAIRVTIADAYDAVGELERRPIHLERALELRRSALGLDHPETLSTMQSLAIANQWLGRFSEAIVLHQQTFEKYTELLGPENPATLSSLVHLAGAYRQAKQWETAISLGEQSLAKHKATSGANHAATVDCMHSLAVIYADAGRLAESLALHEETLVLSKNVNGPDSPQTVWIMETYTRAFQKAGKLEEADRLIRDAFAKCEKADPLGIIYGTAHVLDALALNLILQSRYAESEPIARQALAIHEKRPDDWRRFQATVLVGIALLGQQKYAAAKPLLLEGYKGMRAAKFGQGGIDRFVMALNRIVHIYEEKNQTEEAHAWREKLQDTNKSYSEM